MQKIQPTEKGSQLTRQVKVLASKGLWGQYVSRDPAARGTDRAYSCGRRLTWRAREHRAALPLAWSRLDL